MTEKIEQQNPLEKIRQLIKDSPTEIEREFHETTNNWIACFISRVFSIETWLDLRATKTLLSSGQHATAVAKLKLLKERLDDLKSQYPTKEDIPPVAIKEELFNLLNVLE